MRTCGVGIFPVGPDDVAVDETTFRAGEPLPVCPRCGALARPNILMFGDSDWDPERSVAPSDCLATWVAQLAALGSRLAIVECGAGRAVPTIRLFCEQAARQAGGTLVRLNPREPDVPPGQIALPMGALGALHAIDQSARADQP